MAIDIQQFQLGIQCLFLAIQAFDGNDLVAYFSNTEAGNAGSKSVTIVNNAVDYKIVKATDLGYNAAEGFVFFCIKNSGAIETGYRVVME